MVSFEQKSGGDLEVRVVVTEKELDELEALLKGAD